MLGADTSLLQQKPISSISLPPSVVTSTFTVATVSPILFITGTASAGTWVCTVWNDVGLL